MSARKSAVPAARVSSPQATFSNFCRPFFRAARLIIAALSLPPACFFFDMPLSALSTARRCNMQHFVVLTSSELAERADFNRCHISRMASKGEIPDARRTDSGKHWQFPLTENLSAWICFYRVRHALLKKPRWGRVKEILQAWGTDWKFAVETHDFLKSLPRMIGCDCGSLGKYQLGQTITWKAVEAIVLVLGFMPGPNWREADSLVSGTAKENPTVKSGK